MSDIYCSTCGESWDMDSIHDIEGDSYADKMNKFMHAGCGALDANCNEEGNEEVSSAMLIAHDLMGEDVDGIASMMEDFTNGFF